MKIAFLILLAFAGCARFSPERQCALDRVTECVNPEIPDGPQSVDPACMAKIEQQCAAHLSPPPG